MTEHAYFVLINLCILSRRQCIHDVLLLVSQIGLHCNYGKSNFITRCVYPLESSYQGDSIENLQHDFAEYISFEKK